MFFYGIPLIGGALALSCLFFAMRYGRRQWLLDTLPTSKTTGVFIGMVELKGTAEAEVPLTSYLGAVRCVHYSWQVEEHWTRTVTEHYTDDKGRPQTRTRTESGWDTVAHGGEEIPFYLKDDCGVLLIQPHGAAVEPLTVFDRTCGPSDPMYYGKGPALAVPGSNHRRRFHESAIPLHAPVFIVGQARERKDVVAAEIASDKRAELFLISTKSERQVSRGFRAGFWWLTLLGLVLALGSVAARDLSLSIDPASDLLSFLSIAAGYSLAWGLAWIWTIYNCLIRLRERVNQGWANVDVQLKRRSDLIPALVNTVTGLRDYEKKLQVELAQLRSQLEATPPGEPGPDPAGCLPALRAVAEAYPEIKADDSFIKLHQQLADCENRIALARSYFNEIAALYNARIQVFPDSLVAALARMTKRELLTASDFERVAVSVNLAA